MSNVSRFLQSYGGSQRVRLLFFGMFCLIMISCSSGSPQPPDDKEVIPINAVVHLDGQPAVGVLAMFVPKVNANSKDPTYFKGKVDGEGKLSIGTFTDNDGVPPDDYVLTFVKYDTSTIIIGQKPADLLQGKYSNPANLEHTISVPSGVPSFDAGVIELTSPE